jgi:disulfide bond formation protein DsbB
MVSRYLDTSDAVFTLALGSAAALAVAFVTQYGFGYAPCELCIWQRWPYAVAIALGLIAYGARPLVRSREAPGRAPIRFALLVLATFALIVDVGIAGFHVGVEQEWWEGLSGCGASTSAGSLDDLRAQIMAAPLVRCTDVAVSVLGLSMAAWNALFAAGLALLGLRAILRVRKSDGDIA